MDFTHAVKYKRGRSKKTLKFYMDFARSDLEGLHMLLPHEKTVIRAIKLGDKINKSAKEILTNVSEYQSELFEDQEESLQKVKSITIPRKDIIDILPLRG